MLIPRDRTHRRTPLGLLRVCLRLLLGILLLAGALAGPAALSAEPMAQATPITLSVRAGFDGYYKDTRWIPLRVTVANDGPDASGTLQIALQRNNNAEVMVQREVELPTQSRREIFLYVPTESFTSNLKVDLVNRRTALATATARVIQTGLNDLVYGLLAGSPAAFGALGDIDPLNGTAYVAQLEVADLPPVTAAWQSLDVLVVSDVDTGAFTPAQRAALAGWVAAGGRLVVMGGPAWQRTAAGLSELLPLNPSGTQTLPSAAAYARFALAEVPPGSTVVATGQLAPDAVVLASEAGLPLIISRRSGFGQVIYLAADPAFAPLRGWDGQEGLLRNILAGTGERPTWSAGLRNWYSARDAVNALPGLDFPSALQICGFLGVYLLAVGPVNYLVLKRLKRRELAWLTIPLIVALFSLAAYVTGYQLRGVKALLHRLSIVQVWPDADYARVDQMVGLFSPRRADYDLVFGEGLLARPMPVDPYGSGGKSFTVEQADQTIINDVRMDVGGVEPFVVQGQVPAPQFESSLVLAVTRSGAELQGTVTNHSNVALTDVVVLAPGGVARLGTLEPGASAPIHLRLTNSRASPASVTNVLPAVPGSATPAAQPFYPPSNYDSTIDDILGTTNYYNDRNQYRRYSLLASIIDSYGGSARGSGVYLVGWASASPLESTVMNRTFDTVDTAVYFVNLQPTLNLDQGVIAIPPGLMNWIALNPGQSVTPTPYDMYLYQGNEYVLRFAPFHLLPYNRVQSLTMHVNSYGLSGSVPLNIELWDYTAAEWVLQSGLTWGDNVIAEPARYVGPAGEIQVRVVNDAQPQLSVERLDFTLYVER